VYAEKPRPFDLTKESRNVGHDALLFFVLTQITGKPASARTL
jgi:hypothetical protein